MEKIDPNLLLNTYNQLSQNSIGLPFAYNPMKNAPIPQEDETDSDEEDEYEDDVSTTSGSETDWTEDEEEAPAAI